MKVRQSVSITFEVKELLEKLNISKKVLPDFWEFLYCSRTTDDCVKLEFGEPDKDF